MKANMNDAKANLHRAQQRQAKYADERRRELAFNVDDMVMLSTQHLKTDDKARKLLSKYIGPFRVKQVVNASAYELELPAKYRIHPVFHISKLKPFVSDSAVFPGRQQADSRPSAEVGSDGEERWEVEKVVDKRVIRRGKNRHVEYLVEWKGYPAWERTWEPVANLRLAKHAIQTYEQAQLQNNMIQQSNGADSDISGCLDGDECGGVNVINC
jgi:hypothetical protein